MRDSNFTSVIQRAEKSLERLKSTADKVKANENIKIRLSVENQQRLDRLRSAIEQARANAQKPFTVKLRDAATAQLNKIKSQINSLTGKAHEIVMNVRNNAGAALGKMQGGFSNALNGVAASTGSAFLGLGAMGGLAVGAVEGIKSQADFEKSMSSVKAILSGKYKGDELNAAMTALTEKAEMLGATTKFTAKEAADAMYYAGMAGWDYEKIMAGMPTILNLAAAGNEDLGRTSDIVTDAMTAFGLRAGEIVNLNGRVYESTKHFGDMFGATITNANTDINMMGETLKYAAPLIQSLYADKGAAERMQGAQDTMLITGLMANAGVKSSQAGTSIRSFVTRLAAENRNAYWAENALGLKIEDENGDARRMIDIVKDLRTAFKDGLDMDQLAETFERFSGEKIHADTRRKLEGYYADVQAHGGKMGGLSKDKMAAMLAGQEAMSGWLATLLASDEDFNNLYNALENADGVLEKMADIQMDNLAGSFTLLASSWDAFQRTLVKGDASQGLRSFVDSLKDSIDKANELFKDGIQIGDFGKIAIDLVAKLKNKFLELDGIGSLLAGGALFFGLKKIASLALSVKDSLTSLTKIKTAGDLGNAIRGQNSSAVSTMNVRAGVVNLSGNIKGLNSKAAQNQSRVDEYYRRRQQITGQTNSTTTATSRFKGLGGTMAGAGALTAVFGALDVLATKNNSEYQISVAKAELEEQKAQLQFLQDNNAGQAQIAEQLAKIRAAESHIQEVAEQNRIAEQRAEFGAGGAMAGTMLGAALGMAIPVIGPLVGSMIGGALGEYLGSKGSDLWEDFKEKRQAASRGAAVSEGTESFTEKISSFGSKIGGKIRQSTTATYGEDFTATTESAGKSARKRHVESELESVEAETVKRAETLNKNIQTATGAYSGIAQTYSAVPTMKATFADEVKRNKNAALPEVATVSLNKKSPAPVQTPKFDSSAGFSQYSMLQQQVDTSKVREKFQGKDFSQPQVQAQTPQFAPPVIQKEKPLENLREKFSKPKDFSQPQIQAAPMWTPPVVQTQTPAEISATPKNYSQPQLPTQAPQIAPPVQVPQIELPELNIAEKFSSIFESIQTQAATFTESISTQFSGFGESFTSIFESIQTQAATFTESISTQFSGFGESFTSIFESIQTQAATFTESFSTVFESLRAGFTSFSEELVTSFSSSFESLSATATNTFATLGATIQGGVETARSTIVTAFDSASSEVQAIWNAIPSFFGGIFGGLGGIASAAGSAIASGINSGIGMIQSAWEALSSWLSSKISSLASMASNAAAAIGIGSNAKGTASWRGGFTQVNEHGGELIFLPNGQVITPYQTMADIAHNAKGTSYFEGGWSEVNEHGGELMYLPQGTRIVPHATTVRLLRQEIKDKLAQSNVTNTRAESSTPNFQSSTTNFSKINPVTNARAENRAANLQNKNIAVTNARAENRAANLQNKNIAVTNARVDELGNLQGVNIPEYNRIQADDSLIVKEAKQAAQQRLLQNSPNVQGGNRQTENFNAQKWQSSAVQNSATKTSALEAARGTTITTDSAAYSELQNARREALKRTLAERNSAPNVQSGNRQTETLSSKITPKTSKNAVSNVQPSALKAAVGTRITADSAAYSELQKLRRENLQRTITSSRVENYDELGNLQGVNIPDFNRITAEDSLIVKEAKQAAQLRLIQNSPQVQSGNRNTETLSYQKAANLNTSETKSSKTRNFGTMQRLYEAQKFLPDTAANRRNALPKVQESTFSSANLQKTRKFGTQNDKMWRLYEAQKFLPQTESNRRNALPAPSNFDRNNPRARLYEAQRYLPASSQRVPAPSNYNKNDKFARLQEAQRYLPQNYNQDEHFTRIYAAQAQRRGGNWSASYQTFKPKLTTSGIVNYNKNDNSYAAQKYLPANRQQAALQTNFANDPLARLNEVQRFLPQNFNQQLPSLPGLPRVPEMQSSRTENNSSTTNSNSSVNFNFGGVNINNGADFDTFSHKLMTLFTQGASNSVQY